jgi:toxin ParE1/3/4
MRRIVVSRRARDDIETAINYLDEHNAHAAIELLSVLSSKVEALAAFPYLGRPYDNGKFKGRTILANGYRVFYQVLDTEIFIVRVLHEKRDVPRLLR